MGSPRLGLRWTLRATIDIRSYRCCRGNLCHQVEENGPKVIAACYKSGWYRRTGTSIVTNVVIFLKFENKTDSATTVKDCSLQIEYNGATYGPFQSESLNIEMTSRRATDKRVEFTVPVEMVDITSDIPKAIVTSYYIPKKTKTEVYDIPNAVVYLAPFTNSPRLNLIMQYYGCRGGTPE